MKSGQGSEGTNCERLQKVMAQAGIASRRQAEEYIAAGRVRINGEVAVLGTKVKPGDQIEFDGKSLAKQELFQYYFLYKPVEVITSVKDPQGRKTVLDLLDNVDERVYPVGRLDYHTSGVLLLTNDGELAYRLTHPSFGVEKTYRVWTERNLSQQALRQLEKGVLLEDGMTASARVKLKKFGSVEGPHCTEITIHEGRNRQVRRMFAAIGFPVQKLERIRFGPLLLNGEMKPGQYRKLSPSEIKELQRQVKLV